MAPTYYDLIEVKDLGDLNIRKPERFETDMDERLALQYFVGKFRMSINLIRRMYGYASRQKTLCMIARFLEFARKNHIPFEDLESNIAMLLIDCGNIASQMQTEAG